MSAARDTMAPEALHELITLRGRTAVVTGAASGIGAAIAARLAQAGATVCVADRALAEAERCCRAIGDRGAEAFAVPIDMTEPGAADRVAEAARQRTGRLDVWVNNAGIYRLEPCLGRDDAVWRQTMEVNLDVVHRACQAAARTMLAADRGGCIVNISSVAALRAGHPSLVAYAASKAAVDSLTQNFAAALGPAGIRVLGVAPGVVLTESMRLHLERLSPAGSGGADRAARLPLRRLADPDDIARVVLFACTDLAAYLTGQTLVVDGGDSIGGAGAISRETLLGGVS